ncbi:MAG: ligand-binding sensor domain-containing protein [Dokdonia sp.]
MISCIVNAQSPVSIHLDETDGLPDVEFYDVIEDRNGFIWLAADKGLYRYDGKEFVYFSNSEQESRSVFFLQEDEKGRIWCTNIVGQFLYVENGELHLFEDLRAELNGELAYYFIKHNRLYVSATNSIFYIDLTTKERSPVFNLNAAYDQMSVPQMVGDEMLIASQHGVGVLSKDLKYTSKLEKELVFLSNFRKVIFTHNENNYIALRTLNGNKIVRVDYEKQEYVDVQIPAELRNGNIPEIKSKEGAIWLVTDTGIYIGTIEADQFHTKQLFFEGSYTTQMIEDSRDNYWVTTVRNGVYVIPNIALRAFSLENDATITAMTKYNDSTLLFGTSKGVLISYDVKRYASIKEVQLQSDGVVNSIVYNRDKDMSYISQWSSSSILYHETEIEHNSGFFSGTKDMSLVKEDIILNGAYNRGAWAQLDENGVLIKEKVLLDRRAYSTFYSKYSKKCYVGYTDHLRRYTEDFDSKVMRDTLLPIFASAIRETIDSILWVGTYNAGLYGFVDDDLEYHYTENSGLISNDITLILPDQEDLWVVSDNSIQRLDGKTRQWQTLQSRDGLAPYRIVDLEIVDNTLIFVTSDGFYTVEKSKIFKEASNPDAYISGVQIADVAQELQERYVLPYDKNKFSIDFHSNGFQSADHSVYDYRLKGYDDTWNTLTNGLGNVVYNSLPTGDFIFEVAAKNAVDDPRGNLIQVPFTVSLPFWKQSWFLLILYLSGLLVSVWVVWRRVRFRESVKNNQLKELAVEKQITDLKLENLRTQMNPHFIFNALNSIQEYIVLNRKEEASDYLGKFADLIRTYLDHSSRGFITVAEERACLDMYLDLEKLRFEEKLEYTIDTSKLSNPERYQIPTMLVQPYVENAIKHGLLHKKENRELDVSFKRSADESGKITCVIRDNGIGRAKAKELKKKREKIHKAFATKATKLRLDLINKNVPQAVGVRFQDLKDESGQSMGTKVILTIPYTIHD